MLYDFCQSSTSEYDEFVGLKFINGKPKITFPRGYHLSDDDDVLRKDIVRLLATIQKFSTVYESTFSGFPNGETHLSFPILSYQYIINDFLSHGYYIERETAYISNTHGKINWKRTIQKKQPVFNNGNLVYLDFIVKTNKINENNLITQIHRYCVRESFEKLGWLYLSENILPPKPDIKLDKKLFLTTLNDALNNTFNDSKRMLFISMINIINDLDESVNSLDNVAFGVNRFEYIWERLVDYVFGESNKEQYFPHASWDILQAGTVVSSAFKPDTIMLYHNKLFVLDAKYYKYGITKKPQHLPASSSIQKQITYGKYIDTQNICNNGSNNIYNAFIMPFDKLNENTVDNYKVVSVGTADWEKYNKYTPNYKYVLGILLDTKHIINTYTGKNCAEIENMSNLIVTSLEKYRASKKQ